LSLSLIFIYTFEKPAKPSYTQQVYPLVMQHLLWAVKAPRSKVTSDFLKLPESCSHDRVTKNRMHFVRFWENEFPS
jgi:hypothetical protein